MLLKFKYCQKGIIISINNFSNIIFCHTTVKYTQVQNENNNYFEFAFWGAQI